MTEPVRRPDSMQWESAAKVDRLVEMLSRRLCRDDMYGNASGNPDDYREQAREYLEELGVIGLVDMASHAYWEAPFDAGYETFHLALDRVEDR